jgi:hypothetical protein
MDDSPFEFGLGLSRAKDENGSGVTQAGNNCAIVLIEFLYELPVLSSFCWEGLRPIGFLRPYLCLHLNMFFRPRYQPPDLLPLFVESDHHCLFAIDPNTDMICHGFSFSGMAKARTLPVYRVTPLDFNGVWARLNKLLSAINPRREKGRKTRLFVD